MIDADDPVVGDLLHGTLELLAEAGGWLDPTAVLVAHDGELSLHADVTSGAPLVQVPRAAMVRVDAVHWADDDMHLTIEALPDDVGDLELQMLYLQAALHNQCAKLPWLQRTHPALAPDVPDRQVAAVRRLVPSFRATSVTARDLLWATRCFRLPVGGRVQRTLVPVVDLLNHHRLGASGTWDGGGFTVSAQRPFGGNECALDYGMGRDALELAVVYGFADTSTDRAHSAPVTLSVEGMEVSVLGAGRATDGTWQPIQVEVAGDSASISHLTFSREDPDRAAHDLAAATGWDPRRSRATVTAVALTNMGLLDAVADTGADHPASRALTEAAVHQHAVVAAVAGA